MSEIIVRPLQFKANASPPRYWYKGNPVLTHMFNAIFVVFPQTELFFIETVAAYRKQIKDPKLLAEIKAFTAQEAHHCNAHQFHNDQLKKLGYDIDSMEVDLAKKYKKTKRIFTKKQQLASVVAYEHLTAMFGDIILRDPRWLEDVDPVYRDMMSWHAVEEIEHKAVAMKVYEAIGGNYFIRITSMFGAFFIFYKTLLRYLKHFLKEDGISHWQAFKEIMKFLFVSPASFFQLAPGHIKYFLPNFHPDKEKNDYLVKQWREQHEETLLASYGKR